MAFTPYSVDLGSANTSTTVKGLTPGKQYNYTITPKNNVGNGPVSNTISTTLSAQVAATAPTLVQFNHFRDDATGSASYLGSITLSLPAAPNAGNKIFVMMYGHGAGSDSPNVQGPGSSVLLVGPVYDSQSEVQYVFEIQNDASNSYTFTNYDSSDYSGWFIVEVAGVSSTEVAHGAATEVSTTSVTWPVSAPASGTNCLRFSTISSNNTFQTVGTGSTGVTKLYGDTAADAFHGGFAAQLTSTLTGTATMAVTGGNGQTADTPTYMTLTVYGTSIPAQVTGLVSTNTTAIGTTLSWNSLGSTANAYVVQIMGGSITSWTLLSVVDSSLNTISVSGLAASTSYSFRVIASSPSGQGTASATITVTTLAIQALALLQTASASGSTSGSGTYTLNATFANNTTVGSTLAFFYSGYADANNLSLTPPANSSNATGMLRDDGASTDPICMFWTQVVTTPAKTYSYAGTDDQSCLIVQEIQGVTSIGTVSHAGNLTYVDGASGHVILPVTSPNATPGLGLYFIDMTTDVDSWGTPPTGVTLLKGFTGNSASPTYHHGALFQVASSVSTGNVTIPYTLGNSVTQAAAPTYIGLNFYGSSAAAAPGIVTVTKGTVTPTSVVLNWASPTGSTTSFTVQYRATGTTPWFTYSSTVTGLTATVSPLNAATAYDFAVTSYNGNSAGPISTVVSTTTLPAQVGSVTLGTTTSTSQVVSWTANTGTISSYTIQYKKTSDSSYTSVTGIQITNYTITGLTPSTSYVYLVFAVSGALQGATSTPVTAFTSAPPAPTLPTGVTAGTATDTTQVISWTASVGQVTSYTLQYSSKSSTGPWTSITGLTQTTTIVTGLTPNTIYYYQVIAYNSTVPSPASSVITSQTTTVSAPGQVINLKAGTPGANFQALTWDVPAGVAPTSYTVQYKVSNASNFINLTGILLNSFTVTGLSPSTPYVYQVFALNTTTAGIASNPVTSTTSTQQGTHPILKGGRPLVGSGNHPIEL